MELHISTIQYSLDDKEKEYINKRISKFNKLLGNVQPELASGNMVIHKHLIKSYLGKNVGRIKVGRIKKLDVILSIHLLKASLHAKYEGKLVHLGVRDVFDSVEQQLKKYKQKHFPSSSDYPDHHSLRNLK